MGHSHAQSKFAREQLHGEHPTFWHGSPRFQKRVDNNANFVMYTLGDAQR
jgi:hypothetical protein